MTQKINVSVLPQILDDGEVASQSLTDNTVIYTPPVTPVKAPLLNPIQRANRFQPKSLNGILNNIVISDKENESCLTR